MQREYQFAQLNNDNDLMREITKYEEALKTKTGKDIVLVAYSMGQAR